MTDGVDSKGTREDVKALFLEDYRYLADSFWKNEQSGETRVNLFIGIVTVVAGALVSLGTAEHGPQGTELRIIFIVSLSALFLLGLVTLARMLIRNEATDRYKQGLDTVRQAFKDCFNEDGMLVQYYPVGGPRDEGREKQKGGSEEKKDKEDAASKPDSGLKKWWGQYKKEVEPRKFGGLAHTVAGINSLIFAAIVGAAAYPIPSQGKSLALVYAGAAGGFTLCFFAQIIAVVRREMRAKEELRAGRPTHAGGVVYTAGNGVVKCLLVRAKDNPNEWVLPKGHIKPGEGHGETALREVREEVGVVAKLICLIDRVVFSTEKEEVDVKFYLVEYLYEVDQREKREKKWVPFNEAINELKFAESKYILQEAEKKLIARAAVKP